MKLREILKDIEIIDIIGKIDLDTEISNMSYNSKNIEASGLFVAIKGKITDGHKYIKNAKNHGAIVAVVEDFKEVYIPQIKVDNTRKSLADLAKNFYKDPSKDLKVIGITATNGKTTTSFMLKNILSENKINTGIVGTVYTKFADVNIPSILTTPESLELQKYFKEMLDKNISHVVMEVSSSAQQMLRVNNIDFDIVSFGNLSREHIDQHGSFENYFRDKSKIILNAKKGSFALLNMDNEYIASLKEKTKASVLTFSMENLDSDFGISKLDLSTGFGKFMFHVNRDIKEINLKKQSFEVEMGSVGYASVMNGVIAISLALILQVDKNIILNALENFKGVERRFELIYDEKFKVLDDHFANEKNIDVTMTTLSQMNYKNLHILYAIRGNRGVELNRAVDERLCFWLKKLKASTLFTTFSEDTVKQKDKVTQEEKAVYAEVLKNNNIETVYFNELKDGINNILKKAQSGDIVLLAGCQGMDKGAKFVEKYLLENNLVTNIKDFTKRIDNRTC